MKSKILEKGKETKNTSLTAGKLSPEYDPAKGLEGTNISTDMFNILALSHTETVMKRININNISILFFIIFVFF